jgi:hypothetical protein
MQSMYNSYPKTMEFIDKSIYKRGETDVSLNNIPLNICKQILDRDWSHTQQDREHEMVISQIKNMKDPSHWLSDYTANRGNTHELRIPDDITASVLRYF